MATLNFDYDEYYRLLVELFTTDQQGGALAKLSKVRHTYEDMQLYFDGAIKWEQVKTRTYFRLSFLQHKKGEKFLPIERIGRKKLKQAMEDLRLAVGIPDQFDCEGSGCYKRCMGLIKKIIAMDEARGVKTIRDTRVFLDYFTYNPRIIKKEVYFIENDYRKLVYKKIRNARKADENIILAELCEKAWSEIRAKYEC